MKSLSEMSESSIAKIEHLDRKYISAAQITELLELGFYPGAQIECLGVLPALEKMLFLIGGTKVGLRINDCKHIQISTSQ